MPFRWSGAEPFFSFAVPIDRSAPVELELKVVAVVDLGRQSPISIEVDGTDYALDLTKLSDSQTGGWLVLPPRGTTGETSLTFKVPILLRPNETRSARARHGVQRAAHAADAAATRRRSSRGSRTRPPEAAA